MSDDPLPLHYNFSQVGPPEQALMEAVTDVIDSEDGDLTRAFAAAAGEYMLEVFKQQWAVDKRTTGQVCLDRLRGNQCTRGHRWDDHPHKMPHADHRSLWLREGEPALMVNHLYDLPWSYVTDIVDFCREHGFKATFEAFSWYFPANTVMVVIEADSESEGRP